MEKQEEKQYQVQRPKEDVYVRLVVVTFFGALFHTVIIFFFYWSPIITASFGGDQSAIFSPITLIPLYMATLFGYSVAASLSFTGKRIVSPFHIQLTTIALTTAITLFAFFSLQGAQPLTDYIAFFVWTLGGIFGVLTIYSLAIGYVIRAIVGLFGTEEDLVKFRFIGNASYQKISKQLKDSRAKDTRFEIDTSMANTMILKSIRSSKLQMFFVFKPSTDKPDSETQIAITGYEIRTDAIIPSSLAESRIKTFKRDIEGEIQENLNADFKLTPTREANEAYRVAVNEALKITEIKSVALQSIFNRVTLAVVALLAIGGVLTYLSYDREDALANIVAIWIGIVTTIAVLTVPPLKEKLESKETPKS